MCVNHTLCRLPLEEGSLPARTCSGLVVSGGFPFAPLSLLQLLFHGRAPGADGRADEKWDVGYSRQYRQALSHGFVA